MVKVEITLVFRVLKASQFVYSIGATKFGMGLEKSKAQLFTLTFVQMMLLKL
jgi:hypothetical protein